MWARDRFTSMLRLCFTRTYRVLETHFSRQFALQNCTVPRCRRCQPSWKPLLHVHLGCTHCQNNVQGAKKCIKSWVPEVYTWLSLTEGTLLFHCILLRVWYKTRMHTVYTLGKKDTRSGCMLFTCVYVILQHRILNDERLALTGEYLICPVTSATTWLKSDVFPHRIWDCVQVLFLFVSVCATWKDKNIRTVWPCNVKAT